MMIIEVMGKHCDCELKLNEGISFRYPKEDQDIVDNVYRYHKSPNDFIKIYPGKKKGYMAR